MSKAFKVFKSSNDHFFSSGITRDFGENKVITMHNGPNIFCCVLPLVCDPLENNLENVGSINVEGETE